MNNVAKRTRPLNDSQLKALARRKGLEARSFQGTLRVRIAGDLVTFSKDVIKMLQALPDPKPVGPENAIDLIGLDKAQRDAIIARMIAK